MKIKTLLLWSVTLAALAFASCSGDDATGSDPTGSGTAGDPLQTVRLYLNVPSATATARVGDPGSPTGEGEDWDQLTVMIESANDNVITANNSRYFVRTLSKTNYETLPEQSGYRWLPIDLVEGSSVYIYGVTYSSTATNNPAQAIENVVRNSDSFANIKISNNYSANESGQIDAAKFLSVATGYYTNDQGERTFTVTQPTGGLYDRTNMPTMTLTRLAAKIDIQWDAADAYVLENNENIYYEDVSVDKFTFYTSQENTAVGENETGTGFLFPDLNLTGTATPGKKGFYNTSPISKRNGRVYHYVFPDGKNKPYVTFQISANKKQEGKTDVEVKKNYTFNFTKPLQKSTWYKINTTIKGLENGNTTIEITPEGPGGTATTE